MPNSLGDSASPYLLQHADNPVDWYEWGDEAFAAAARRDLPILLSVGYAACHWCHVMAHESFEDPATAAIMNERFVNIKVDREERPDIDRVYMEATQAMTGRGGWPMTVFLTPDARPFFAGTYFPNESRHGVPSFTEILHAVSDAWSRRRPDVEEQAGRLTASISVEVPPAAEAITTDELAAAYRNIVASVDRQHGGFGTAPKFPQAPVLEFLLRIAGEPWAPQAGSVLSDALHAMAAGGIYDHVGGGFARYSVDDRWLVPHFEKMLYDNALLARLYLRAWQVCGDGEFRRVATETLDYLVADLMLPEGAMASSEDADSEGGEGTFYVWGHDEFLRVVGADGRIAASRFGVTSPGNFEGRSVLHLAKPIEEVAAEHDIDVAEATDAVARARSRLVATRAARPRPARDDKAIASWNGLALRALAEGAAVLNDAGYLRAAQGIARFLTTEMRRPDGRLLRSRRRGSGNIPAFCDDYGATVLGLIAMNVADGDAAWLELAVDLGSDMVELFARDGGGFYGTGSDADDLIVRSPDLMDNPVPSGNSLAAEALMGVWSLTGRADLLGHASGALRAGAPIGRRHPSAVGHLLAVAYSMGANPRQLAIVGDRDDPLAEDLVAVATAAYQPDLFVARAGASASSLALFRGKGATSTPAAYLCRDLSCDAPTSDPVLLAEALRS